MYFPQLGYTLHECPRKPVGLQQGKEKVCLRCVFSIAAVWRERVGLELF